MQILESLKSIKFLNSYGFPMLVALLSVFYLGYLTSVVGKNRRAAQVKYPTMYATEQEAKADKAKFMFNCAQRVHQNELENFPIFITFLGIAGYGSPFYAGLAGLVYLVGRYLYQQGYMSGDVENRHNWSIVTSAGLFGLTYLSIQTVGSHFGFRQ